MENSKNDSDPKPALRIFDRLLFTGVIISHILVMWEPIKHGLFGVISKEWSLILYVILITIFWSIYVVIITARHSNYYKSEYERLHKEKEEIDERYGLEFVKCKKNSGYIVAYKNIALGFSLIHLIQRGIRQKGSNGNDKLADIELFMSRFQIACTHFADGFNSITGKNDISVSIMLINRESATNVKHCSVETFIRDSRCTGRPVEEGDRAKLNLIEDNTHYIEVLKLMKSGNKSGCYVCNDLPQTVGYKSGNFAIHNQMEYDENLLPEQRSRSWKLFYRSMLVAGIYATNLENHKGIDSLIGFICVYSDSIDTFDPENDTKVLTGITDGIYNTLIDFNQFKIK